MSLIDSHYHPESTVDIRAPWGCPSCGLCNGTCPPLQCHKEQFHRPRIPLCPPARGSSVSPPGVSCCGATQFLHRHRSLESGELTFGEARRLPTDPATRDVVTLWKGLPRSAFHVSEAGVLPVLIHACSEGLRGTPLVPGPCPGQDTWCRQRHTLADGQAGSAVGSSLDLQEAASAPSLGLRECLGPAGPSTPVVLPHDSEVPHVAGGGQCLQLSSFLFRVSVMTQVVGSHPQLECEDAT